MPRTATCRHGSSSIPKMAWWQTILKSSRRRHAEKRLMIIFRFLVEPIPEMAVWEYCRDLSMATSAVQAVLQSTRSTAMRDFEFRDGKMRTLTCEFANTARHSGQCRKTNDIRADLTRQSHSRLTPRRCCSDWHNADQSLLGKRSRLY